MCKQQHEVRKTSFCAFIVKYFIREYFISVLSAFKCWNIVMCLVFTMIYKSGMVYKYNNSIVVSWSLTLMHICMFSEQVLYNTWQFVFSVYMNQRSCKILHTSFLMKFKILVIRLRYGDGIRQVEVLHWVLWLGN